MYKVLAVTLAATALGGYYCSAATATVTSGATDKLTARCSRARASELFLWKGCALDASVAPNQSGQKAQRRGCRGSRREGYCGTLQRAAGDFRPLGGPQALRR